MYEPKGVDYRALKLSDWNGKASVDNIINSKHPTIVLFAAHWCGYCAQFMQLIQNINSTYDREINLIDTDDPDESLWDTFRIKLVPTLIVFKNGEELSRRGARSGVGLTKADLDAAIEAAKATK